MMLREVLAARFLAKTAMKEYPDEKVLQKVMNARQLAIKLLANVTCME